MNSLPLMAGAALLTLGLTCRVRGVAGRQRSRGGRDLGEFGNWNAGGVERIKDLATIAGVRDNQLIGYGLVVGLDGTGDQTTQAPFSTQSLKNMLGRSLA
jgi:flagellar P-ring protein FlgI